MISFGKRSLGTLRRRPIDVMDDVFHKSEWMETGTDPYPALSPTVFLAEQPPDCALLPHFHRQNQFQLFVDGAGSIGKEPLRPVTVHYAGAYTGYGPILSGPEGLKYFTIRSSFDTGLIWADEAREKMVRGPKRHAQASVGAPWSVERLSVLDGVHHETAIAPSAGLGAELSCLPPRADAALPPIEGSVGQFVFVLAGTALLNGATLEPWESAFVPATDGVARITAGAGGAEIIALHMPQTAAEYVTREETFAS